MSIVERSRVLRFSGARRRIRQLMPSWVRCASLKRLCRCGPYTARMHCMSAITELNHWHTAPAEMPNANSDVPIAFGDNKGTRVCA